MHRAHEQWSLDEMAIAAKKQNEGGENEAKSDEQTRRQSDQESNSEWINPGREFLRGLAHILLSSPSPSTLR